MARPRERVLAGLIVFLPFPILLRLYVLPGLALFGLLGLAVPAAVYERLDVREALRRGWQLGRADVVHAIAGMATLALVYGVSRVRCSCSCTPRPSRPRTSPACWPTSC